MISMLGNDAGVGELLRRIGTGGRRCAASGLYGSSRALVAAAIAARLGRMAVAICEGPEEAEVLAGDARTLAGDAVRVVEFPAFDVLPTEAEEPDFEILALRSAAVRAAGGEPDAVRPLLIATPIQALMQPVFSEGPGRRPDLTLSRGTEIELPELAARLVERGLIRRPAVEAVGEFCVRGGIVDIWPMGAEAPVRIEMYGDTAESLREFDPASQRSERDVESVTVSDASAEAVRRAFSGGEARGLPELLPPDAILAMVEPERIAERAALYAGSHISGRVRVFTLDDIRMQAGDRPIVEFRESPVGLGARGDVWFDVSRPVLPPMDVAAAEKEWRALLDGRRLVAIFCETEGDRELLLKRFGAAGLAASPSLRLCRGDISSGFDFPGAGIVAVPVSEALGRAVRVRPHAKAALEHARVIEDFLDLQPGDTVVHTVHGIARYLGLEALEKDGKKREYLALLFDGDVKLYVSASQIHLVQKYVGAGGPPPPLSRIGSRTWARKKEKVAGAVRDIAAELLAVQAARRASPGIALGPDSEWQADFERAFPFEETPDQIEAARAVKADLEAPTPMDRLLCGDVGFGKTEIAMRAAFKVAAAGRQAAVLVPTTLLCEQHFRTFSDRFAGYPLVVESISRFKSAAEQRRVLERLAAGAIDVIVGTHRLLQRDVVFRDLGLAIIDEEQRFGVEHKEFFKRLRASVNVLTLTATPIPRTLHMALMGLRDISALTQPPAGRLAIKTRVVRWSEDLIRRASLRELNRGGQIYFVHNRVEDIESIAARVGSIVPEARIVVGHGQMEEDRLESVMRSFLNREADILVCTTIIESGIDIPSVNTIFINEADRFGLADLHQLRGRVGRWKLRAFAYLMVRDEAALSGDALRRLRAIEEFDELGAGFRLAMRDLEIRGAGNLLGPEQSGHIAEVGYDMYCRLLEEAVRRLKGLPVAEPLDVTLDLPGEAGIGESYVPDEKERLEIYRRFARCGSEAEVESEAAAVADRYGRPGREFRAFREEAALRIIARDASIPYAGLDRRDGRLILKLYGWDRRMAEKALRQSRVCPDVRCLADPCAISIGLKRRQLDDPACLRAFLRSVLECLRACAPRPACLLYT
ncbi:MAG: transcription-repair coupling factor, partial [Planctomycetota bacterium]|nr:transcription-repair coupling factor [Planctomycetota bacterium]